MPACLHAKIMRPWVNLDVEIIPRAVYSNPFPIHGQLFLDSLAPHKSMWSDNINESFIGWLLRKRLWFFCRLMREMNMRRTTSKLLQTLFGFLVAPFLLLWRWQSGTL